MRKLNISTTKKLNSKSFKTFTNYKTLKIPKNISKNVMYFWPFGKFWVLWFLLGTFRYVLLIHGNTGSHRFLQLTTGSYSLLKVFIASSMTPNFSLLLILHVFDNQGTLSKNTLLLSPSLSACPWHFNTCLVFNFHRHLCHSYPCHNIVPHLGHNWDTVLALSFPPISQTEMHKA